MGSDCCKDKRVSGSLLLGRKSPSSTGDKTHSSRQASLEKASLHNEVKNSKPHKVKLATDRGKPRRQVHEMPFTCRGNFSIDGKSDNVATTCLSTKRVPVLKVSKKELPHRESQMSIQDISLSEKPQPPKTSFPFDCNSLIIENKKSIYDRYKELEELGRGSRGVVKKVMHRVSEKVYALKMMRKISDYQAEQINKEIEIFKKLVNVLVTA